MHKRIKPNITVLEKSPTITEAEDLEKELNKALDDVFKPLSPELTNGTKPSFDLTDLNEVIPPRPDVSISLEYVSPLTAYDWSSEHNRKLISNHAAAIARDMSAGRFHFTGVPVIFAKNQHGKDVIIDGDHRKNGVITSQRGQWFIVVRGLDGEAQQYIDINQRPRHVRDLLSLHRPPIEPSQTIAAAGSYFACWESYGWFQGYATSSRPTPEQIYNLILSRPRLRELAILYARTREPGSLPASIMIAIHTILDAVDQAEAKNFMHDLYTGDGLALNSPIWLMRRWISRYQVRKGAVYLRQAGDAVLWLWTRLRAGEKAAKVVVPRGPFKIE